MGRRFVRAQVPQRTYPPESPPCSYCADTLRTLVIKWYTPNHWLATPATGTTTGYRYTITDLTGADTSTYQGDLLAATASESSNLQSREVEVSPPSGSGVYRVKVTAYNLNGNVGSSFFPTAGVVVGEWQLETCIDGPLPHVFSHFFPTLILNDAGIPAVPGKPTASAVSPARQITFSFTGKWLKGGFCLSELRSACELYALRKFQPCLSPMLMVLRCPDKCVLP